MNRLRLIATFGLGLVACIGLSGAVVVVTVDQTALVSTLSTFSAVPFLVTGLCGLAGFFLLGNRSRGRQTARS